MAIKLPTVDDLARIARELRLGLSPSDVASFWHLLQPSLLAYVRLDQLELAPVTKYPREGSQRPAAEQNQLNAWYWRCDIHGNPEGPLKGKTFAIKDNVAVAEIPMMNNTAAGGLRRQYRRYRRHANTRRGRHHFGQIGVRKSVFFWRQSYF